MNYFVRLIATACCSCIFSDTAINLCSRPRPVPTREEAIAVGRRILTLKYPGIVIGNTRTLTARRSSINTEAWDVFFHMEGNNPIRVTAPFVCIRASDGKILESSWIPI